MIKCLIFISVLILIAKIEEIEAELGKCAIFGS